MDRLLEIFILPETVSDLKRRVDKLEAGPQYRTREPKVYIVADEPGTVDLKEIGK